MSKETTNEHKAQKVEIIIVGARNRDPVTFSIIEDLVTELDQHNVKTVLCPALESKVTAEMNMQVLADSIPEIDKHIEENYQQFVVYKEGLKLPFFPILDQYKMKLFMQQKYSFAPLEVVNMALQSAIRNESNKKHVSLLQKVIELNIPYKGIDDLGSVPAIDAKSEHNRVIEMAKHIIGDGVNALKGSCGVIICDVGSMYAPKLAAILRVFLLLKDILNISSITQNDTMIKVNSVFVHSPYVEDELEGNQTALESLAVYDPLYLQNMYKEHPIQDIAFSENQVTGQFHSDKWDSLVSGAIKFVEGQD